MGKKVTGVDHRSRVRGVPVIADSALQVPPGFGQFLPRPLPDPAFSGKTWSTTPWLDAWTIAVCQTGPIQRSAARAETVDRLVHLLEQATAAGAEIAVFPEMALTTSSALAHR